ncbi:MAG TPA: Lrp/AsnC family transcriptional regulator [Candidatus Aminicenantes bacterium]|nr:Lrp/AsnC family transcriptional regulator [Candidatus Aminicenantes bacterium]HEB34405.1 Lrp/AsnC family transcriptional regulator [Candidatus Aminicenantes bacterium]
MKSMKIEELDRKILKVLNRDARMSFRLIAKELRISPTTLYNKVKKLESSGVLKGYIPLIDKESVGYDLMAIISLRVRQEKDIEVQKVIAKLPQVGAVYEVTGDWDLILVCYFKGRDDLANFLKKELPLSGIERAMTHLVLNVVKEEKRIPV